MASPAAVLNILVKANTSQAVAGLRSVDAQASKTSKASSKSLSALGGVAKTLGVTMGATGLALGVKHAVAEFREAEKVGKQTSAVLKSTGGAAGVTRAEVEKLAGAISRKTGIDDEQIQASQNMLLTFTNVRNEVGKGNDIFNRATQVVTDMSVALGQSGKSSAIQLGKALQDPVKGITALRRVGVAFTEQQQDQIKKLVASGNTLKAQKMILRELTREFGGSAAAQATAGDKLRTSFNNLFEAIGGKLVPIIDKASRALTKFMDQMQTGKGAGGEFVRTMKDVGNVLGRVLGVVKDVASWLGKHPALLKVAAGAWVAYKTAALIQLGIAKAAMFGMFGGTTRAKLAAEAGTTGGVAGKSFAAKAGLAAAAGVAGWEMGKWLRKNVPAVKSAGDFIGNTLGKAIYGGAKDDIDLINTSLVATIRDVKTQILGIPTKVPKAPKRGTPLNRIPGLTKVPKKKGVPKKIKASDASIGRIIARAAGEAGGAELGSLQSALAWVRAHYGGLLEAMIEDAGGSNQHLHIASGNVVAIGKALQAMGFSVSENPAFGGVRGRHAPNSYHYKGMAIDVNADYRTLRAGGGSPARTRQIVSKARPRRPNPGSATRRAQQRAKTEAKRHAQRVAAHRKNVATMRAARTVNRTLENPWIQAALTHIDNLVAAGYLDEAGGNAKKTEILRNALDAPKGLMGEDRLIAEGMIRSLAPSGASPTQDDTNQALLDAQEEANRLQEDANRLAEEQNARVAELRDELKRQNDHADAVNAVSLGAAWKALADMVSGQIAGPTGYQGRSQTAGAGSTYRL